MQDFKNVTTMAFDLDGTIYTGNKLIEGVVETLNFLRSHRIKILFFTNNSTRTRKEVYDKLIRLGITLTLDEVYTSSYAAALYIKQVGLDDFYCLGEEGLRQELIGQGITIADDPSLAKNVVIGLYTNFHYGHLVSVLDIYRREKCKIIVCNEDMQYPVEEGRFMPGCGPIVASIKAMIDGVEIESIGKPNDYMLKILMHEYRLDRTQIAVVGDSYSSDIAMALKSGVPSIWLTNTDIQENDTRVIQRFDEIQSILRPSSEA